uniref:Jacalin-related lectin 16 n=1 Tax=Noccaea caerulescens TaxID=107243 RepID=A0A1J3H712_NOCCA
MVQRVEMQGCRPGYDEWDDGSDHDDVSKIYVQGGLTGIQYIHVDYYKSGQTVYGPIHGFSNTGFTQTIQGQGGTQGIQFIKFDYIKDGQPKDGPVHGFSDEGVTFTGSFEINYLEKEYLVSIEGFYDEDSNVIQGLQFKTNMNTSDMMGYDDGKRFLLATNGKKIIGFHGYADKHLNSLGAYFITLPPIKLESQGRRDGCIWDDGAFEGVKKVYVHYEKSLINYIGFDYDNGGGKVKTSMHGAKSEICGHDGEFVVDYPNEFITSVEGIFGDSIELLRR